MVPKCLVCSKANQQLISLLAEVKCWISKVLDWEYSGSSIFLQYLRRLKGRKLAYLRDEGALNSLSIS